MVKENDSKVPNTPIAVDMKGVPEFKEMKARKSHSIRLNSNSQSQKSQKSRHTEKDEPKNPERLFSDV